MIKTSKRANEQIMLPALLALFMTLPAIAAPSYPDKAYEAVSENLGPMNTTTKSWSDGKGHLRSETTVAGITRPTIIDFINKISYSIDNQNKTVMKMPFNGSAETSNDPNTKWEDLGSKVIDGHPCTGKRGKMKDGSTVETWTGNDTGCAVLVSSNGKPVMKLKSWKATAPNPSLFAIPAGYKTTDLASMMKGLQAGGKK